MPRRVHVIRTGRAFRHSGPGAGTDQLHHGTLILPSTQIVRRNRHSVKQPQLLHHTLTMQDKIAMYTSSIVHTHILMYSPLPLERIAHEKLSPRSRHAFFDPRLNAMRIASRQTQVNRAVRNVWPLFTACDSMSSSVVD
jgi:hypothetical protein